MMELAIILPPLIQATHTPSLLLSFTPPRHSYLRCKGLFLRRVDDSTVLRCLIVMEM